MSAPFEIFCVTVPGMEDTLLDEVIEAGFPHPSAVPGGVAFVGHWTHVWRANLQLRGATRILARVASFRAIHLSQLYKQTRQIKWEAVFHNHLPIRVDVTTKASKIYHAKAAAQKIEAAITDSLGVQIDRDADIILKVRIEDNLCTFSIDTSGAALHLRNHKQFVGKAPMRENLAALFLRQCGYTGTEPVLDPMCGSGTFPIEAAEIAAGLFPCRSRDFAFTQLASFKQDLWEKISQAPETSTDVPHFYGSDRDAGAIKGATDNALRSEIADHISFTQSAFSDITRPDGPSGLIMINPPYGDRIGNKKQLFGLYGALGKTLKQHFSGWRIGLVTSDNALAKATNLPFKPTQAPIPHGGIRITLHQTAPLP